MKVKKGDIFYCCWPYTNDNGRVEITVDEYVVRSIQRKRNSQQRWGVPALYPDDTVYVNCVHRIKGLTITKGVWGMRKQFRLEGELPFELFTTPLQALKFALKQCDTPAETRAVKTRITKLRSSKKKKEPQ